MCLNPNTHKVCEKCLYGSFWNCAKGRCIHGSFARSVLGSLESILWNSIGVYRQIDTIICCSYFMKRLLDTNPALVSKTIALHNFVDEIKLGKIEKKNYVLYFGRFSQEKGIATLVQAAKALPDIPFVFAGSGPLEYMLEGVPNIQNVGFQSGKALETLIKEAQFSISPSEGYENCPFSVLESQMLGTMVLGAQIGGIPELIQPGKTGNLFTSGDCADLKKKIQMMWIQALEGSLALDSESMVHIRNIQAYTDELMKIYSGSEVTA